MFTERGEGKGQLRVEEGVFNRRSVRKSKLEGKRKREQLRREVDGVAITARFLHVGP